MKSRLVYFKIVDLDW